MAATNKCLAQSNKSRTGSEATNKRESSVSLQAKRDDKSRASGRYDFPSDDVGLHRRRGGLRRDRVTAEAGFVVANPLKSHSEVCP